VLVQDVEDTEEFGDGDDIGGNGGSGGDSWRDGEGEAWDASLPSRLWSWFQDEMAMRPLWTKVWSSSIVLAFGDVLAQAIEYLRTSGERLSSSLLHFLSHLDPKRIAVFFAFGGLVSAPLLHLLYDGLEHFIPMPSGNLFRHGPGWKKAFFLHLLVDQLFIELVWLASFFIGVGLIEGKSFKAIQDTLRRDYKKALIQAWKVWPILQAFNFSFVPSHNRVITVSLLDVGWTTFLSLLSHDSHHH